MEDEELTKEQPETWEEIWVQGGELLGVGTQDASRVHRWGHWDGRLSGLPWQQLGASLSVWPLTAAAPDWLRRPAPPLLHRSLTLSSSCILP